MNEKGNVTRLKKNYRYVLVRHGIEAYLIDTDQHFLSFIWPYFQWHLPLKVWKIPRNSLDEMIEDYRDSKSTRMETIGLFILTNVFYYIVVDPLRRWLSEQWGFDSRLSLFLSVVALTFSFRFLMSWRGKQRIGRELHLDYLTTYKVRMRPTWAKRRNALFFGILMFWAFTWFTVWGYFVTGDIIPLILFVLFFLFATILNWGAFHPTEYEEGKGYYDITFLSEHAPVEVPCEVETQYDAYEDELKKGEVSQLGSSNLQRLMKERAENPIPSKLGNLIQVNMEMSEELMPEIEEEQEDEKLT